MTLKQIACTSFGETIIANFVYFETDLDYWWCFPSIVNFCQLKTSPSKIFRTYRVSKVEKKVFSDFQNSTGFVAKQTLFVSTQTLLDFLTKWNEKEKKLNKENFDLLVKTLQQPQGRNLTDRVSFTAKKPVKTKMIVEEPRREDRQALITIVRTSLTLGLVAQEILCEDKLISFDDRELLKNYCSQINEYIEDLPIQTTGTQNDFIDIPVNKSFSETKME